MNDTTPEAAAALAALLRSRSGSERVLMMSGMFQMARALVIAGIKDEQPDIDEAELRVKVFARFYGSDFTPSELANINERLREAAAPVPGIGLK
jgi:hypothetical protein